MGKIFLITLLAALAMLAAFPSVLAQEALVLSPGGPYNLGDKVDIIIYVDAPAGSYTYVNLDLIGNETEVIDIADRTVDKTGFQRIKIPYNFLESPKQYHLRVTIETGNTTRTMESALFDLSDKLIANFAFNKDKFMVGETLIISGDVLKQNYFPASGEIKILGQIIQFFNGEVEYVLPINHNTPTSFDIEISDIYGNSASTSKNISIATKPFTDLNISKTEFKPGDELVIVGSVKNIRDENVDYISEVLFNDGVEQVSGKGSYEYSTAISPDFKPGDYVITVNIWDDLNNYVGQEFLIQVLPVMKALHVDISKEKRLKPEQTIEIKLEGKDQSELPYAGAGTIKVFKGDEIYISEKIMLREGKYVGEFLAPKLAGEWTLQLQFGDFVEERILNVKEIGDINFVGVKLVNGMFSGEIINQRNVNLENLVLLVKDKEGVVLKEIPVSLKSGESIYLSEIDLEAPAGSKIELREGEVVLGSGGGGGLFTGFAVVKPSASVSITALIILAVLAAGFVFYRYNKKNPHILTRQDRLGMITKNIRAKYKKAREGEEK